MIETLFVVALLTCTSPEECTVQPLVNEAYKGEEDCNRRAARLSYLNPGKEYICGVVKREKGNDLRRTDTGAGNWPTPGIDHFRM